MSPTIHASTLAAMKQQETVDPCLAFLPSASPSIHHLLSSLQGPWEHVFSLVSPIFITQELPASLWLLHQPLRTTFPPLHKSMHTHARVTFCIMFLPCLRSIWDNLTNEKKRVHPKSITPHEEDPNYHPFSRKEKEVTQERKVGRKKQQRHSLSSSPQSVC